MQPMCRTRVTHAGSASAGLRGFTLVELLVVISIIALLAAILLPVLRSSFVKADKGKAQHEMAGIMAALRAFYGDYGKWPGSDNGRAGDVLYGGKGAADKQSVLMDALRGVDRTSNPRGTSFLDVPRESMQGTDADNQQYVQTDGYFLDPWGNPYLIALDTDFNGTLEVTGLRTPPGPGGAITIQGQTMRVFSYGPDLSDTNSLLTSMGAL